MKTILALETSCDETAVAILRGRDLLATEVASQIAAHEKYGGVVPEVASRNHLVHAPELLKRATHHARIDIADVDAFAATSGPGLASSLMIGASIAKGLAIGLSKPFLAINHLEGHLLSPFFGSGIKSGIGILPMSEQNHGQDARATIPPNISLIVSGGHTMSMLVRALSDYQIIGRTVDDAAGEAFDKVAKMLGLGYPGGPQIEERARDGDPKRFNLPRSMPDSGNFSFSGLKTAVRYLLPKIGLIPNEGEGSRLRSMDFPEPKRDQSSLGSLGPSSPRDESVRLADQAGISARDDKLVADLCASFQQAIIDVLVRKTIAAARKYDVGLVTVSGGVSCNQELRGQLREECARQGFEFKSAEQWLCTDNAAMIAFAGALRLQAGFESKVTEEIDPNLALG